MTLTHRHILAAFTPIFITLAMTTFGFLTPKAHMVQSMNIMLGVMLICAPLASVLIFRASLGMETAILGGLSFAGLGVFAWMFGYGSVVTLELQPTDAAKCILLAVMLALAALNHYMVEKILAVYQGKPLFELPETYEHDHDVDDQF